jgi:hypothetical protein
VRALDVQTLVVTNVGPDVRQLVHVVVHHRARIPTASQVAGAVLTGLRPELAHLVDVGRRGRELGPVPGLRAALPALLLARLALATRRARLEQVGRRRPGRILGVLAEPGPEVDILGAELLQLGAGRRQLGPQRDYEVDEVLVCGRRFDPVIRIFCPSKSSRT